MADRYDNDYDHRTDYQKDLDRRQQRGETLSHEETIDLLNHSYPPTGPSTPWKPAPKPTHEDDIKDCC